MTDDEVPTALNIANFLVRHSSSNLNWSAQAVTLDPTLRQFSLTKHEHVGINIKSKNTLFQHENSKHIFSIIYFILK